MKQTITYLLQLAACFLFVLPLTACAATVSSKTLEGKVLEDGSHKPIANAMVIVRWIGDIGGIGHGSSVCFHVETATTDDQGRFRTPAWKKPSPYGDIAHRHFARYAYAPGHAFVRVDKEVIYLQPFTGGREEKLAYLSRMAVSCSDKKEIEINLLPLYKALYEEARNLTVTRKEDKLKVLYRLRDVERLELVSDKAWENFRQRERELK